MQTTEKPDLKLVQGGLSDELFEFLQQTIEDPGFPLEDENLAMLADLKEFNPAMFERLHGRLKRDTKFRVTELEKHIARANGESNGERPNQANDLVKICDDHFTLFHRSNGDGFADLIVDDCRHTLSISSPTFRRKLRRLYLEAKNGAPNSDAMKSALSMIEAKADAEDAPEREVYKRTAEYEGKIYIDLSDDRWRAVEVDDDGWRIVDRPPVRFVRSTNSESLPVPESGGSIDLLRPFLNVRNDREFALAISFILAALRPKPPYPVMVLVGEQGTAKTTFTRFVRSLVDPQIGGVQSMPRQAQSLFVTASNTHLLSFDNTSGMSFEISDTLCQIVTKSAFSGRALYTNADEHRIETANPVIVNGIDESVTRSDLASRSLFFTLETISNKERITEDKLWADFEKVRSRVFGCLLDALSAGLRNFPHVDLAEKPRMADFAEWGTACETAFWPQGTFMSAYNANLAEAVETMIEANPVALATRQFMHQHDSTQPWKGTAQEYLKELNRVVDEDVTRQRAWPKYPNRLSDLLRRATPDLEKVGIVVTRDREGSAGTRVIQIAKNVFSSQPVSSEKSSSASSASSALQEKISKYSSLHADDHTGLTDDADGGTDSTHSKAASAKPLKTNGTDNTDDADGQIQAKTGRQENNVHPWNKRVPR